MSIGGAGDDDGRVPIKALMSGQDVGAVNRLPMLPGSRVLPSYEKRSRQCPATRVLSAKLWTDLAESHGTGHAFLYPAKPCDASPDMACAGLPWQPRGQANPSTTHSQHTQGKQPDPSPSSEHQTQPRLDNYVRAHVYSLHTPLLPTLALILILIRPINKLGGISSPASQNQPSGSLTSPSRLGRQTKSRHNTRRVYP
jgi:hypothetical protein